ncbi:MAG: hypothetical protein AABX19_02125 [Nanoarchaeota archaeon]
MDRLVEITFIGEALEIYNKLNEVVNKQKIDGKNNSDEMQLLKSIKTKIDFIKLNPFYGNQIKKIIIPKEYSVDNLWRVELIGFYRMLYTIDGNNIKIVCFILDLVDHDKYNKKFGYRNK